MNRVLVIDDSEEFREMLAETLADAGYEVKAVSGPDEAGQVCNFGDFTMILCDIVMPIDEEFELMGDSESAMVGVHTISKLSKEFPGVPVIAMSGKLDGINLGAISNFGAFAALPKPFSRDQLLSLVERVHGIYDDAESGV